MSSLDKLRGVPLTAGWSRRPEVLCSPSIPLPMHGMAPRIILGQEWWDAERAAAFASTAQHCIACGIQRYKGNGPLQGHEIYSIDFPKGRMTYVETVPLCETCHRFIHTGYLETQLVKGEILPRDYSSIMAHGWTILRDAGLARIGYRGEVAAWDKWRLVLQSKRYPLIYKSRKEWENHFHSGEAK